VVVVAFAPSVASLPGIRDDFFAGVTEGAPTKAKLTIDGVVVQKASGGGESIYAWQRYAAFVAVIGQNGPAQAAITRALIAAEI